MFGSSGTGSSVSNTSPDGGSISFLNTGGNGARAYMKSVSGKSRSTATDTGLAETDKIIDT